MANKGKVRKYVWEDKPAKIITDKDGVSYPVPRPDSDYKYHYVTK